MKRRIVEVLNSQGEPIGEMPVRWRDYLPFGITFRRGFGIEFGQVTQYTRRHEEVAIRGYVLVHRPMRPAWLAWYSGGAWSWSVRWLTDKGIRSLNKTGLHRC